MIALRTFVLILAGAVSAPLISGCAQRAELRSTKIYDAERVTVYAVVQAQALSGLAISAASQEFVLWTKSNSTPLNSAHVVTDLGEIRWLVPVPPPLAEVPAVVAPQKSTPIEATPSPQTVVATLRIPFATGSSQLSDGASRLMALAMQESVVRVLSIEGHTDSTGSPAINEPLAAARAKAVADQIKKLSPALLLPTRSSRAAEAPIASNLTEEGRTLNRRVALELERDATRASARNSPSNLNSGNP